MNEIIVNIDESLIKQFESLPSALDKKEFTPEKKALLVKYWPIKKHSEVANLLGFSVNTCLKYYRELTE